MKNVLFSAGILFLGASCFAQNYSSSTTTTTTSTTVSEGMPGAASVGMSVNGQPVIVGTAMPMTVGGVAGTSTTYTTTTTTTNGGAMPLPAGTPACAVSPQQFENIKGSISSKTFEDTKVSEATQIMTTHCLSSAQVRDIMRLFGYENNRLTFAQNAYSHTLDPANYYMVNDAFEFPTSVNQLNASIGQ